MRAARRVPCAACLVRPPGHHVARDGKTAVAPSQGFCLLNSVAVAALEASANGFEKVAVVDFDVHHGNGTEDILQGDDRFFFASVHAFGGGTYPGTGGARTKSAANVLNVPLPPPIKKSGPARGREDRQEGQGLRAGFVVAVGGLRRPPRRSGGPRAVGRG